MARILSIDPGHTTGIAVLDDKGEVEISLTVRGEKACTDSFMRILMHLASSEVILIESLPSQVADRETENIRSAFNRWFRGRGYEVIDILPGQWKGLVERVQIPGQHARDAATMARFYIEQQKARKR